MMGNDWLTCEICVADGVRRWHGQGRHWASLVAQMVRNLPAMQEMQVPSLCGEDPLEKVMAARSNILAWRNPRTKEPGRLQSMDSKELDTTE